MDGTRPVARPRHAVLRSMLNQAMREEVLARNVARLVQPPTPQREEIHPWADEEARSFLAAARTHRLHALFVVALALGLRRGDLLGLRWADVDLSRRQLRVWQTLLRFGARASYSARLSRGAPNGFSQCSSWLSGH